MRETDRSSATAGAAFCIIMPHGLPHDPRNTRNTVRCTWGRMYRRCQVVGSSRELFRVNAHVAVCSAECMRSAHPYVNKNAHILWGKKSRSSCCLIGMQCLPQALFQFGLHWEISHLRGSSGPNAPLTLLKYLDRINIHPAQHLTPPRLIVVARTHCPKGIISKPGSRIPQPYDQRKSITLSTRSATRQLPVQYGGRKVRTPFRCR